MDIKVVADLLAQGAVVRNSIVKIGNEALWSRDGEMPWEEFARIFAVEHDRALDVEASLPKKDHETDADAMASVDRVTRYAMRQILDSNGLVLRTQFVTTLLGVVAQQGLPEHLTHALVLHEKEPKFGLGGFSDEPVDRTKYTLVAELLLPASPDVLEKVYRDTNAIDAPWHPTAKIRSTSMGDIVILIAPDQAACSAHQVRMMGYEEVQFA